MNLYSEEKRQKRPISATAVVRIVVWALVLLIVSATFAVCMVGNGIRGSGLNGAISFGYFHYDDAGSYTVGGGRSEEVITSIDIEWLDGKIDIVPIEGDAVTVSEDYAGDDDEERLRWKITNGRLTVKYRAPYWSFGSNDAPTKGLTVGVPADRLEAMREIRIETTSSDVTFTGQTDELSLDMVDGALTVNGYANELDVDGVDLRVNWVGSVGCVDVDGVNVTLDMHLTQAREMDIDGVDTQVTLYLADSITGFAIQKDSLGGKTTISGFNGVTQKDDWDDYWGDGTLRIDLDGVDSKLIVNKETNH